MATMVLISTIYGLLIGGALMALWSKQAAMLDARISFAIAHAIVPRRMKRAWRRAEGFKKNAGTRKIIRVYKIAGIAAVILGAVLALFLLSIS